MFKYSVFCIGKKIYDFPLEYLISTDRKQNNKNTTHNYYTKEKHISIWCIVEFWKDCFIGLKVIDKSKERMISDSLEWNLFS